MKIAFTFTIAFIFICGISGNAVFAQSQKAVFSNKAALEESVKTVSCKQEERLEGVRKLFMAAGASETEIEIEKFNKDKISNVVVRKKGESAETIIIGAHYDMTDEGCGATDNWTGISIITHIYNSLRNFDTKKSYVFVAFDQEEAGLKGSSQMTKAMSKDDVAQTCSMVNFDSFGQAGTFILSNVSSPKIIKFAKKVGKDSDIKIEDVSITGASSDSASFVNKKIPAITFSGLGRDWQSILHTSNDKIEKVDMASVYFGYQFGLLFISKLDAEPCDHLK